jgi:gas vesicle protein
MTNRKEELDRGYRNPLDVVAGMLIGAAAGAAAMLLLAPRSGRDTRTQIKDKFIELRERGTEMVDDTLAQVRESTGKIARGGREKAAELKEQGQELLAEQLERVSAAAQAGKRAVQSS